MFNTKENEMKTKINPRDIYVITIKQVDCFGPGLHREFKRFVRGWEVDRAMQDIERAYNMEHTQVTIS